MGSPNFFTGSQFDSFGAVDEDFSSEYDAQDVRDAIAEEIDSMSFLFNFSRIFSKGKERERTVMD